MNRLAAGSLAVASSLVLPGGTALATTGTTGSTSVGSGNQVLAPVTLPVHVCGLSVAILGIAGSGCGGGAEVQDVLAATTAARGGTDAGGTSVGSGNKVSLPVRLPLGPCGVSVALLGSARSGCAGNPTVIVHQVPQPPCPKSGGHQHRPPRHHKHPKGPHKHKRVHHPQKVRVPVRVLKQPVRSRAGQPVTLISHVLPTTGANFVGILALAFAALGSGIGALLCGRRPARR